MNAAPPRNTADEFATAEPINAVSLALDALDGLDATTAFEPETLERAARFVRAAKSTKRRRSKGENVEPSDNERAVDSLFARVRAVLGGAFGTWEREVLSIAALAPNDTRARLIRSPDASENVARLLRTLAREHVRAGIYRRADALGIVTDDGGAARFKRIPWETLATCADEVLTVFDARRTESGRTEVSRVNALALRCELAALLGGDLSSVPELRGFALGPVLRSDGSVFEGEGFDAVTGYFARAGRRAPLAEPTPDNARAALDALLAPFGDFPFEGLPAEHATAEALRANPHAIGMVAAVLTAVCRSSFDGPAPAFLIEANTQGAGKSLLAFVVGTIATGAGIKAATLADDEAERRKSIMAKLVEGEAVIALDNAKGTLGGPALESALTSEWFSDRVLGQTGTVSARNNALWLLTGNNCNVTSDLARRVQPVRLSFPNERPEDRDTSAYAIPDLKAWVSENRAALVSAAITLVRAFILAGRPRSAHARGYGSFEGWDATIRHALLWVGAADPDTARQEFRERADVERDALADLLGLLRDLSATRHNGGPMYAGDVLKACATATGAETELLLALRDVGMRGGAPTQKGIGRALSSVRDKVCRGMKLEGRKDRNGVMMWSVEVRGLRGYAGSVSNSPRRDEVLVNFENTESGQATPQNHANPASPTNEPGADEFTDDVTVVRQRADGTQVVLHHGKRRGS
jgi:hypothetical protein